MMAMGTEVRRSSSDGGKNFILLVSVGVFLRIVDDMVQRP
jgi:hypothetical protein